MGIHTGWVDTLTFGLGSGIAGMAGVALSQIGNVSPNLGQLYIVDSFMVVVFGGVGNLAGTLVGCNDPRCYQQVSRTRIGSSARQGRRAGYDYSFYPAAASRSVCPAWPGQRATKEIMNPTSNRPALLTPSGRASIAIGGFLLLVLVPVLNLFVETGSGMHIPDYLIPLFGKYACYALLALSLDLVWGYVGILSLGHGAFFALGGYGFGMYLMRSIGNRGVYGNSLAAGFYGFFKLERVALVLVRF